MASDKDRMLSSANYYAGIVSSARSAVDDAAQALNSPKSTVSSSWKGASGAAMLQALEDIQSDIKGISAQLASLESQMRAHARSVYNSWPEETEDEE